MAAESPRHRPDIFRARLRGVPKLSPAMRATVGLVAGGVLLALWYVFAFPTGFHRTVVGDLVLLVVPLLSAALCLRAGHSRAAERRPWFFFGLGCLAWAAGQLVWCWYELVLRQTVPYPSLADVGYLLMCPFCVVGLVLLIRQVTAERPDRAVVFDCVIVIAVIGVALYKLLLRPLLDQPSSGGLAVLTSAVWQLGTFVVMALAAVAIVWRGDLRSRGPLAALLGGLTAFAVGNAIYGRAALRGDYHVGHPLDLAWVEGFLLLGVGALLVMRTNTRNACVSGLPRVSARRSSNRAPCS